MDRCGTTEPLAPGKLFNSFWGVWDERFVFFPRTINYYASSPYPCQPFSQTFFSTLNRPIKTPLQLSQERSLRG